MKIFVTGATGFIGSAIVAELLATGHQVLGLTRSDSGAQALLAAGAEAHHGDIEDAASLRRGADQADGVIHCAFDHDFSNFVANCAKDGRVIAALGDALRGSSRPLLITSGVAMGSVAGAPADEDEFDADHPHPRAASERAGAALLDAGINVGVMRLPQVHDTRKQGLITPLVELARDKGVSAFVGEGLNGWSAAHRLDVARAYRLALEKQQPGARYNAVAEAGIAMRDIARAVGQGLNVPVVSLTAEQVPAHFGWMALFADADMSASSAKTRQRLGWQPTGPGLIEDLLAMRYS